MTTTHPHSRSPGDALTPHARGLRVEEFPPRVDAGIIPACAGFTRRLSPRPARRGDHPRMRGVYMDEEIYVLGQGGSSPHARGLHPGVDLQVEAPGIIPARAGFTIEWGLS